MNKQNYLRLGVGLGILFIAVFVMGVASAYCSDCRYTEYYDDGAFGTSNGRDINIETDGSRLLEYTVYRETATIVLGSSSSYTCAYLSTRDYDSRWRSGELCPGDDISYSTTENYCYYIEYESYDCMECDDGDDDCDDYEYMECNDGEWDYLGEVEGECDVECFSPDDKCSQYDFIMCNDFEWDNLGKRAGECGIDCLSNNDCDGNDICENYVCEQNECDYLDCDGKCDGGRIYPEGDCDYATQKCVYPSSIDCEYGCDGGDCADDPCEYVTCEDKCDGKERNANGYCDGGVCVYQETNCEFGCDDAFCEQDPCLGVDISDRCDEGKWFNNGYCEDGRVLFGNIDICTYGCEGEPVPMLAAIIGGDWCRASPCDGVVCDDYCSGETKMTGGACNSGKCEYSEQVQYNKDCGHLSFYEKESFQIAGAILVLLVLIVGFLIYRGKKK